MGISARLCARGVGLVIGFTCVAALGSSGCATRATTSSSTVSTGIASWYGPGFHGRPTASGERYDQHGLTAAHRTWPLGTEARVTNLSNGRTILVRINDRGPFIDDREIDLSYAAACALDMVGNGTTPVRIEAITPDNAPLPVVHYAVQVASFFDEPRAAAFRDRVRSLDGPGRAHKVYVVRAERESGTYYRVRVGPWGARRDAESIASQLAHAGLDSMVVEEVIALAN